MMYDDETDPIQKIMDVWEREREIEDQERQERLAMVNAEHKEQINAISGKIGDDLADRNSESGKISRMCKEARKKCALESIGATKEKLEEIDEAIAFLEQVEAGYVNGLAMQCFRKR